MRKLDRIYRAGQAWNFSRYFDYIDTVASGMPASLRAFASDIDSYTLGGNKTLHDARIYRHHIILGHDGELQIEFARFSHEWTPLPT